MEVCSNLENDDNLGLATISETGDSLGVTTNLGTGAKNSHLKRKTNKPKKKKTNKEVIGLELWLRNQ